MNHLFSTHKNISSKEYFDTFVNNKHKCFCGKETEFVSIFDGYAKYCSKRCMKENRNNEHKIHHANFEGIEVIVDGIIYKPRACWVEKFGKDIAVKKEKERLRKEYESKMENGSLKSKYYISKNEDALYKFLCTIFEETDIFRQVRFKRWNIDFYIKSVNCYVEYNGNFWHGNRFTKDELFDLKEIHFS